MRSGPGRDGVGTGSGVEPIRNWGTVEDVLDRIYRRTEALIDFVGLAPTYSYQPFCPTVYSGAVVLQRS